MAMRCLFRQYPIYRFVDGLGHLIGAVFGFEFLELGQGLAAENGGAAGGVAHFDVAAGVADQKAGIGIEIVFAAGSKNHFRRRFSAMAGFVGMVRAEIDRIEAVLAELALHAFVNVVQRGEWHQAAPHAALIGYQRQKKPALPQSRQRTVEPSDPRQKAEHLPREHELAGSGKNVDDAVAVEKNSAAGQGGIGSWLSVVHSAIYFEARMAELQAREAFSNFQRSFHFPL